MLALDDQERLAALRRDVAALDELWPEEFTVNAPNHPVVAGRPAVMGGLVFLMGLETLQPNVDAPAAGLKAGQTVQRRFTNIWKKEPGGWRLFARHTNVIGGR